MDIDSLMQHSWIKHFIIFFLILVVGKPYHTTPFVVDFVCYLTFYFYQLNMLNDKDKTHVARTVSAVLH